MSQPIPPYWIFHHKEGGPTIAHITFSSHYQGSVALCGEQWKTGSWNYAAASYIPWTMSSRDIKNYRYCLRCMGVMAELAR